LDDRKRRIMAGEWHVPEGNIRIPECQFHAMGGRARLPA